MKKYNQLTLEDRIELCDRLRNEESGVRTKAYEELISYLDSYIWYFIHNKYPAFVEHHMDMYQEAIRQIIEACSNYNPQFKLTTYFDPVIKHVCFEYVATMVYNSTVYYFDTGNKILKVIDDLTKENKKVTIENIKKETGFSEGIIKNSLAYRFRDINNNVYYDGIEGFIDTQLVNQEQSALDRIIEKETRYNLHKAIAKLEPLERAIVLYRSNKQTWKYISSKLNISIEKAKLNYNRGIRNLQKYFKYNALTYIRLVNVPDKPGTVDDTGVINFLKQELLEDERQNKEYTWDDFAKDNSSIEEISLETMSFCM